MTATRSGVLLLVLYVVAVWLRFHDTTPGSSYYYNGESATRFRVAASVAEKGQPLVKDERSWWPEGYAPARTGPTGTEYFTGQAYRLFSKFSDMSLKRFSELLTALTFSLSVFAYFFLVRSLWGCTAAAIFAAFMAATFLPLIEATDGRTYDHAPFAATVAVFGAAALARWVRKPSFAWALATAAAVFVLHTLSEWAGIYAVFAVIVGLARRDDARAQQTLFALLFAAVLVAGATLPHLQAQRYLASRQAVLAAVALLWALLRTRLPARLPGTVVVIGATVIIAVLVRPLASGGVDTLSPMGYWFTRLRFLFGKPDDPLALSDAMRVMWSYRNAPPGAHGLVSFFVPFLLILPAAILGLRRYRAEQSRSNRNVIALALVAAAVFVLDRATVFVAAPAVIAFVAVSFYAFRSDWRRRGAFVLAAVIFVCLSLPLVPGRANVSESAAAALGASRETDEGFLWVSIGNSEEALVRHLVSRTSVGDLFVAPPRVASLMVQFAGRKLTGVPGVETQEAATEQVATVRAYYENEARFYERCRTLGVDFVVYSIDLLMDTSKYSPRYTGGIFSLPEQSVAHDMHFRPERLSHFTLVYENDNYRLYRVTEDTEPIFLTDHPPVYQRSLLKEYGPSIDVFYTRIVDVLLAYASGLDLQGRGLDRAAIPRFRYSASFAPKFTNAWIGIGDSLLRTDDPSGAAEAFLRVLELAPDNAHALYYCAVAHARLGDNETALGMLEVLSNSGSDRWLLEQGRELQRFLRGGGSLEDESKPVQDDS
jgi:hypothetical protein